MAKKRVVNKPKKESIEIPDESWDLDFDINQEYDLTDNQIEFMKSILAQNVNMCFIDGPAGTSKTYLAVLAALKLLKTKKINNIIYIRSIIESASRSMGALPGELEEKFAPWSMPLIDKLEEILEPNVYNNLLSKGYIKCIPVNFTRGLTFKNACVIIDEAQNLTTSELVTILTRFGVNSKYIIVGDTMQSDIGLKSGFSSVYKVFSNKESVENGIITHIFDDKDIVRSEILKFIVNCLEQI